MHFKENNVHKLITERLIVLRLIKFNNTKRLHLLPYETARLKYAVSDCRCAYPVASLNKLIYHTATLWCDAITLKMRLPAASN